MTLDSRLLKLYSSEMEKITLYKDGVVIYSGTILNLKNTRKDLLKLDLDGDLAFKVGEGYKGNCL